MNAARQERPAHPPHARIYTMPERSAPANLAGESLTIIRRKARRDDTLSHQARHLFEDIVELSERDGYCSAGDQHFADCYGTSRRTVRRWIAELRDAGYLRAEGATKSRTLTPTMPGEAESSPEAQPDLGHDAVLSEGDLGHDLGHSGADLGHNRPSDLGHPGTHTWSNTPPEGERGARVRVRALLGDDAPGFGAVTDRMPLPVAIFTALVGRPPHALFWPDLELAVPDDERHPRAFAETVATWTATREPGHVGKPYNLGNIRGLLKAYREAMDAPVGALSMAGDHLPTFDPNA